MSTKPEIPQNPWFKQCLLTVDQQQQISTTFAAITNPNVRYAVYRYGLEQGLEDPVTEYWISLRSIIEKYPDYVAEICQYHNVAEPIIQQEIDADMEKLVRIKAAFLKKQQSNSKD